MHTWQVWAQRSLNMHSQALIADFMLVWLPAPSLNLSGGGGGAALKHNPVTGFFASCPDNAFQVMPNSCGQIAKHTHTRKNRPWLHGTYLGTSVAHTIALDQCQLTRLAAVRCR